LLRLLQDRLDLKALVFTPNSDRTTAGLRAGADVTNGVMPLTVHFSANASDDGPIHDYQWTFEDGDFSTTPTPRKFFDLTACITLRLTVTDANAIRLRQRGD